MDPVTPSRVRRRSPSLAALLSFVWPGLGQLYLRRRGEALVFALPALVLTVFGVLELLPGPVVFALRMLSPGYALAVAVVTVLFGMWRGASLVRAYISGAGQARPLSRLDGIIVAVLLVAVLATHSVPAYYAFSVYDTDTRIAGPAASDWHPQETPDPSEAPVLTTPAPPSPGESLDVPPSVSPSPSGHRVSILLTGIDFGPGRTHALTDTMLLVSVDLDSKKVALLSVPRDTAMFPLYWNHGTLGPTFKLNALTTAVTNHWFAAPDDAWTTLRKEIGYLVGIPIDYYAAIDLSGFVRMVDMVGGVDIVNPKPFYDSLQKRQWAAGPMHLDGPTALLYVRSRYGDNDYVRSSRQQDVLVALEKKLATPSMIVRLPEFLNLAQGAIRTDYPLDRASEMAAVAENLPANAVVRCVLGPPYSYHPDSATTNGVWTSRLRMDRVAALSVWMFGKDSAYSGRATPKACGTT